jgi:hypothetical protein
MGAKITIVIAKLKYLNVSSITSMTVNIKILSIIERSFENLFIIFPSVKNILLPVELRSKNS